MRDPTIPRHRGGGTRGLTTGRLVWKDTETVALRDRHGNSWSLSSVAFHVGTWGSVHEGTEKLPRAWRYDDEGNPVVRGDLLLIDFIDGNAGLPVVLGVVRSTTRSTDFLSYSHKDLGKQPNRLRIQVVPLDDDGNQAGEVRVKVADNDEGTVELEATTSVRLSVGTDLDGTLLNLTMDGDKVTVERGGIPQALVQADYEADMATYLQAMAVFVAALMVAPTADPGVIAAAGAFQPPLATFLAQVQTGHTTDRLDAE